MLIFCFFRENTVTFLFLGVVRPDFEGGNVCIQFVHFRGVFFSPRKKKVDLAEKIFETYFENILSVKKIGREKCRSAIFGRDFLVENLLYLFPVLHFSLAENHIVKWQQIVRCGSLIKYKKNHAVYTMTGLIF